MSKDYSNNRQRLSDRLKSEPVKTPIQEVRPVDDPTPAAPKKAKADDESHINFWVPAEMGKRLRVEAALSGKSIKQICMEALEAHLPKRN